jgi:hypothetical protein
MNMHKILRFATTGFLIVVSALQCRGQIVITGTMTGSVKTLNSIRFADQFGSLAAAYADLPSTGGTVMVPAGYSETMSADLTVNKSNSGFLFLGKADIQMGTHQTIVSPGTVGVFFDGTILNGGGDTAQGARFTYSGTGSAFLIGSSSTPSYEFRWSNIAVFITGAAGATGISLDNVVYFEMDSPSVVGNSTAGTFGLVLDGTGVFTGSGYITNAKISGVGTCIKGTGTYPASMNAVTIVGGRITSASGIGLDLQQGDSNAIFGTDFSGNTTGIKFGAGAVGTFADIRTESNTTDVQALAGSVNNVVKIRSAAAAAITTLDAGTTNHFSSEVDGNFGTVTSTVGFLSSLAAASTLHNVAASTSAKWLDLGNTGNSGFYFGIESSAGGGFFTGSSAYDSVLYSAANNLFIKTPLLRTSGGVQIGASGSTISDSRQLAQFTATLGTTAATSDNVAITGVTSSSKCSLTPTNALAATNIATTYISSKTTNQITVSHSVNASMNFDILCSVN